MSVMLMQDVQTLMALTIVLVRTDLLEMDAPVQVH